MCNIPEVLKELLCSISACGYRELPQSCRHAEPYQALNKKSTRALGILAALAQNMQALQGGREFWGSLRDLEVFGVLVLMMYILKAELLELRQLRT